MFCDFLRARAAKSGRSLFNALKQGEGKTMGSSARLFGVIMIAAMISACGGIHSQVVTKPENVAVFKQLTVLPVQVTSKEQNADALALNEEWKRFTEGELQSLLTRKNISASSNGDADVACNIDIKYGNRALRYFVGFGAGAGQIAILIELKDKTGNVRYRTRTDSDLAMGGFGGDMSQVVRNAIRAAAKEFVSRL